MSSQRSDLQTPLQSNRGMKFSPVHPENRQRFEEIMTGNCFASIGIVTDEPELAITGLAGGMVIKADLAELKEAWQKTLREL